MICSPWSTGDRYSWVKEQWSNDMFNRPTPLVEDILE